jgi:hypothetical protein
MLALLIAAAATAEFRSIPRADVAFLLFAADRVLNGARLYVDVVEINPPLIVALNVPVVVASRALALPPALVYQLAVFSLLGLCLAGTSALFRRLFPDEPALRHGLIVLLALVLFAMPGLDFGEREHLMLALILPYVWVAGGRVAGWSPPLRLGALVGICAGVGFALKPQFLPAWVLVEGYRRWRCERRISAPAPESLAVLAVLLVYGVIALVFSPQYFAMLGLLGAAYGRFLYEPLGRLLLVSPSSALTLLAILAFVALRRDARHGWLWDLLLVVGVGTFLGGLLQFKGLEYHFYPAKACAILVLGLACLDAAVPLKGLSARIYRVVAAATVLTTFVLLNARAIRHAVQGAWSGMMDVPLVEAATLLKRCAEGGSVFVFSYHIGSSFPLLNYAGVESASRFPQLWILAAEYLDQVQAAPPLAFRTFEKMSPAERYLNAAVLADLERGRPRLLLVLRNARDLPVNGYRRIDYLAYFGRNPRFAAILQDYEFVRNLGEYAVYRRLGEGEPRQGPPPTATPGTSDLRSGEGTGVHLLIGSAAFLLSAGVFLIMLAWMAWREFRRRSSTAGTTP